MLIRHGHSRTGFPLAPFAEQKGRSPAGLRTSILTSKKEVWSSNANIGFPWSGYIHFVYYELLPGLSIGFLGCSRLFVVVAVSGEMDLHMILLAWSFLALVWGSTWLFVKVGLRDLPPITFAGLRFSLAAVGLMFFVWRRGLPIPRQARDWKLIGGTALVSISLHYALQFWGQQYITSGLAAVLAAMLPVFVLLFAHRLIPAEQMTIRKLAGVLCSLLGVVLIFSDQLQSEGIYAFWGAVALVAATLGTARAQVMIKKYGTHVDPMTFTAFQMGLGALPLLLLGFLLEGSPFAQHWSQMAIISTLYLGLVGSGLAFLLLYWLYGRMQVTKVLSVTFLNPLVALLLGWIFLGEELAWRAALGGVLILMGLMLTLFSR